LGAGISTRTRPTSLPQSSCSPDPCDPRCGEGLQRRASPSSPTSRVSRLRAVSRTGTRAAGARSFAFRMFGSGRQGSLRATRAPADAVTQRHQLAPFFVPEAKTISTRSLTAARTCRSSPPASGKDGVVSPPAAAGRPSRCRGPSGAARFAPRDLSLIALCQSHREPPYHRI
jgi:hypothetical protein